MSKVVLTNVSKSFGEKEILKNINLEINDGEFIVLVGASGCGKSTLLRMVAGLEKQTDGNIFIGDVLVNDVHPKDRNMFNCNNLILFFVVITPRSIFPTMRVPEDTTFRIRFLCARLLRCLFAGKVYSRGCILCHIVYVGLSVAHMECQGIGLLRGLPFPEGCSLQ